MAVLFGCRAGQFSLENPQKRQGVFSYYLVKGLEGEAANPRGEIALSALMDFAQAQVERDSDRKQQPWLNFNGARMIIAVINRPAHESPPKVVKAPDTPKDADTQLLANLRPSQGRFRPGDAAVRGGTLKGSLTFGSGTPVAFALDGMYRYFQTLNSQLSTLNSQVRAAVSL